MQSSLDSVPHRSSTNSGFGGMRKGFLFSTNSQTKPATTCFRDVTEVSSGKKLQDEDIPFITAKKECENSQDVFDEFQQAIMKVNDTFSANKGYLSTLVNWSQHFFFLFLHCADMWCFFTYLQNIVSFSCVSVKK